MDRKFTKVFQGVRDAGLLTCADLLLIMLANHHRGGWKLADLVKASGISAPTVGMAKDSLLKKGLVSEHLPVRDRRVVKVYLTEEGEEKAAALWKAIRGLCGIEKSYRGTNPPD